MDTRVIQPNPPATRVPSGIILKAATMNRIIDAIPTVSTASQSLDMRDYVVPQSKRRFGHRLYNDSGQTKCRIYKGAIVIHGKGKYELANGYEDVTLTGSPEYVYVKCSRYGTGGTATIDHASSEPVSTTDELRVILLLFTPTSGVYRLTTQYQWGDIHLDSPLR